MSGNDLSLMELMITMTQVSRAYKAVCDRFASRFGLTQAIAWPIVAISRLGDGVRPGVIADAVGIEPSFCRQTDRPACRRRSSRAPRRRKRPPCQTALSDGKRTGQGQGNRNGPDSVTPPAPAGTDGYRTRRLHARFQNSWKIHRKLQDGIEAA